MKLLCFTLAVIAVLLAFCGGRDDTLPVAQVGAQPQTVAKAVCPQVVVPESTCTKPLASKRMRLVVTAYCQIPKSSKWTAKQRVGTCATDPRVIPYGSTVRVAGRNLTAMGRHGKSGRVLDIFVMSRGEAFAFGRRTCWARVESKEGGKGK